MSHFERTEGAEDNLGNNPDFKHLEELAVDPNETPCEVLMRKEHIDEDRMKDETEDETPVVSSDFESDDEPSNWEDDVEKGKYDPIDAPISFHTQDRVKRTEVIEHGNKEDKRSFDDWEYANSIYSHNVKPKRPEDDRGSVRFKEAS